VDASQESLGGSRRRQTHSAEFKARLVATCLQPGVSVALIARTNGVNANLLHRWVAEHRARSPEKRLMPEPGIGEQFLQLPLASPRSVAPPSDIRIELRRGATTVNLSWPIQAADACATWLRAWLG
jgi:transposase